MAFVLYGHLIAFVICARWTGEIMTLILNCQIALI